MECAQKYQVKVFSLQTAICHVHINSLRKHKIRSLRLQVARRIPPRVDDVVRSLYPPLDARLLEARVAALVLAVTHLALVTKHGVPKSQARKLAFIDQALHDMDSHLLVLRNAALAQEAACAIPASTPV